ncbi:ABC-2 transporter permease [Solibacillus sp. FSL H8-0538]|uniref:ABC-2 transporter permease n=1 Tax=Solibacillus sp. FSL H8-0538 TaxID=2921400 RepID=UPI0030FD15F1
MQALLLKDILMLQKQIKMMLWLLLIISIAAFIFEQGVMLISVALIFGTLQVTTVFVFDESCQWDKFAGSLPVNKKDIVQSRYVLGFVLTIGSLLIVTPILFIVNLFTMQLPFHYVVALLAVSLFGALFMLAILLPINIKFGSQKGRLITTCVFLLPTFTASFITGFVEGKENLFPPFETLVVMSYALPFIAFIIVLFSYQLSVVLYRKKQF